MLKNMWDSELGVAQKDKYATQNNVWESHATSARPLMFSMFSVGLRSGYDLFKDTIKIPLLEPPNI